MNELIELAKRLMTADWALASWIVALVSAWTLVAMCAYLSRATDKPYFTRFVVCHSDRVTETIAANHEVKPRHYL